VAFQQQLEEGRFAEKLVFSDKVTFHVCGKVNHHNVAIWDTEKPHAMVDHIRDLPKVNVFFVILTMFHNDCLLAVKPASMPMAPITKQTWRDFLPIVMLLSAVSVLVVVLLSLEVLEGLGNYPV
jgi:hypothetical protein